MVRILSPQLGIAPGSNQGGTVFDRELLKALAGLGVRIDIPVPRGEPYEQVPGWHVVETRRQLRTYFEYNAIFLPVANRLRRTHGFDLYRVHSPTIAPLGLLMQQIARRPLVAHYHHVEAEQTIHNRFSRWALPRYDLITVDSRFVLDQLVATFGVDPAKAVITYPGVAAHYRPGAPEPTLRARLGLEGRTLALTMSLLTARKNVRLLLDAFAQARAADPGLALLIAGDGPERSALEAQARTLGLENDLRFLGYVDEAEKLLLLRSADLFVFASRLEGFGMVVAEAMACGLPVVCSNAASLPEVTGDAALLAAPTDAPAFAAALLRLAADADLRRKLGAEGRERTARLFSWPRTAAATLDAYRRLLPAGA